MFHVKAMAPICDNHITVIYGYLENTLLVL